MAKKYDAGMKVLLDTHLADWLALVPRKPKGRVRVIDSDLATVTAEADKVLLVEDPQPWILHVELQSKRDASLQEEARPCVRFLFPFVVKRQSANHAFPRNGCHLGPLFCLVEPHDPITIRAL